MTLGTLARRYAGVILGLGFAVLMASTPAATAQNLSTGALSITVHDPAGAVINGASLVLTDLETNDVHKAVTGGAGTADIPYLNPARYSLTVTRQGFSTKFYPEVVIQTNQITDLQVTLEVGVATQTVTVSGNTAPILDTTDNTLSTTVDMQEVQDLPVFGRDAFTLAFLVPGAVGNNFDNLPGGAVDVSDNGFSTETNRFKSGGFDTNGSTITNRLEDTQEMTIQTSELDATHGGTSTMDIGFVTKRGTNSFHGMLFEDHRNDAMNANSWYNNATGLPRGKLIINDFGASVGGPILRDKLFFFASLANFRQPFKSTAVTEVATSQALSGIYTYIPSGSTTPQTDNVLQAGASAGCSTCTATINPLIAQDISNIQSTYNSDGATLTPVDLNHQDLNFLNKGYTVEKFPTLRLDYNLSDNFRLTGSANESNFYNTSQYPAPYPGPLYANQAYSNVERGYQIVTGFDWNIRPSIVNAFRVGYLYTGFTYNSQGIDVPTAAMTEQGDLAFGFGLNSGVNGFASLKGGSLYPVLAVKDDTTWIHGSHSLQFGVESETEIDHYYNNQFVPYIGVNYISTGDPVTSALVNSLSSNAPASAVGDVEGLYATLNGRMTYYSLGQFVNAKSKQFQPGISFNLHERLNQTALFIADSWRVKPTLTLNYGLRWDFTGASKDETGFYTHPTVADMWGPTPVGAIFQPGNLGGVQNPVEGPASEAYAPTYVHPEPNVGIAWNPRGASDSWFSKLAGDGKTVFRASYTFKNYTEGAQNFWNFGSNNGANFNTYFYANPVSPSSTPPGAGFYNAGSEILGGALPALASTSPDPFNPIITEASQGFSYTSFLTFDPHIKQPYVESWSAGIQRELSRNNVLEVRYVGNVSKDQWLGVNYNEVNIFENGFLTNFQAAQANLAASGGTTFQGSNATPLFDQAFAATGASGNYTNGQFITWLQQGQAGAFANALAGNPSYLCSMINAASFSPCAAAGASGSGTYPTNVFQANPYAAGAGIQEMQAVGYSNYNSLQTDFRQNMNHGMQFDVNYTLAHSLENNVQGSLTPGYYGGGGNSSPLGPSGNGVTGNSAPTYYTLRDRHLNYFPSSFDVRHVLHASGIYELPFGHGRPFFNTNPIANYTIGGWTLGTILTYESGTPFLFYGGTEPFNTNDGGITLTSTSYSQLKSQMRIRHAAPGIPWVNLFDPKYYSASGQANTSYISPNFNAGTIGTLLWLHAPKWINTDMSLTKLIPLHDQMNLTLQGEFLNVFNHPAWTGMDTGVQDYTFGTTSQTANLPRNVEVRGNFQF
ncbi:MAG TPA: carboxypeptidase-like regulatory domain-containing protein [Acidobacteriaceae bacterium]|nr:carboxypeptidase-like regulatory domain-containing protein [Acidobacteriaceae bacterium]